MDVVLDVNDIITYISLMQYINIPILLLCDILLLDIRIISLVFFLFNNTPVALFCSNTMLCKMSI